MFNGKGNFENIMFVVIVNPVPMMAWYHRYRIKLSPYQFKKSHCRDKTILRQSYLHNGISYTGKISSKNKSLLYMLLTVRNIGCNCFAQDP